MPAFSWPKRRQKKEGRLGAAKDKAKAYPGYNEQDQPLLGRD